jgi:hypothetical protein
MYSNFIAHSFYNIAVAAPQLGIAPA